MPSASHAFPVYPTQVFFSYEIALQCDEKTLVCVLLRFGITVSKDRLPCSLSQSTGTDEPGSGGVLTNAVRRQSERERQQIDDPDRKTFSKVGNLTQC